MFCIQALDQLHQWQCHLLNIHLALNAGRAFGERQTLQHGPTRKAQRIQRFVERIRHGLRGVWVDDKYRFRHGESPFDLV